MYDIETRRRLAEELVDAFCEGSWRATALAERAAGRLDRRPDWLDPLAVRIERATRASGGPRAGTERRRRDLVHDVERFLGEHAPTTRDARPPELVRLTPPAGPRWRTSWFAHDWPVAPFASPAALAQRLELSDGQLAWLADVRGLERTVTRERLRNYRYRWVPRRGGPPRLIEAPKLRLKEVQRIILREILDAVPTHEAACGFVRGRSVIDHAERHCGQPAVLRLDLRDFFASVSAGRVFAIFSAMGYLPPVAHVLTGLTTNSTAQIARQALLTGDDPAHAAARSLLRRRLTAPHLPQGAPTSPALANLATFALDRRLSALAHASALSYSRYADDIAFSGVSLRRGANTRSLSSTVAKIVRDEGFRLHPAKSQLRTAARRQVVTGMVVNAHPNVARDEYDRLRATLHRLALDGPEAAVAETGGVDLRAHLHGRVGWVESLNPARGAKLRRQLERIDWDAA